MPRLATRNGSLAIALAFVLGVGTGVALSSGDAWATDVDGTYRKLRVFSQVLSYVQANYVDDVGEEELIYDSISGMLRDLDPHTTFMRPAEFQKLREDTAGEFGGLGIRLVQTDVGVLVEAVDPEGSAGRAGLQPGDRIVAIDGDVASDMEVDEVAKRLRGVPGTKVIVTIARAGWASARDVPLIRRHVRVDSIDHGLLEGGVGYVRIYSFQERTDHELAEALSELRKQARAGGGRQLGGLVLDMRDNPGGLLEEGVKVADRFLGKGDIVRTEGRNPRHVERQVAHDRGTEGDYPMVVLINGGTASASEIVAGALQDHGRARIVGARSFGKGSVQTLFGLEDGSGLKLTIARYFTPNGRSIQKVGIEPDMPVAPGPADAIAPAGAAPQERLRRDAQLKAAIAVLQSSGKPF
jgi:carboxyl-terminal processing protease